MDSDLQVIQPPHELGLSDEENEAYYKGVRAACEAMRGDRVYYDVLDAGNLASQTVNEVANYIEVSINGV